MTYTRQTLESAKSGYVGLGIGAAVVLLAIYLMRRYPAGKIQAA
jgi:hypothetical protein